MLPDPPRMNTDVYARTLEDCFNAEKQGQLRAQQRCQALSCGNGLKDFLATLPDATLVRCVTQKAFDSEAFELLVLRRNAREDRLRKYFLQHGLNDEEALDLLQNLYVRMYTHGLPGYEPPRSFESYLFAIARNLMLDRFRQKRLDHPLEWDCSSRDARPEQEAIKNEEAERLRDALSQLPELDAALFRGYWEENARLHDLAQLHGLSIATVSRRLAATKKTLRAALRQELHP